MTNKEAIEVIKSMGLIVDSVTQGKRRTSIYEALTLAIKALEEERPLGKWNPTGTTNGYWAREYQCSICGALNHWCNYCPHCGAHMTTVEQT